MEEFNNYSFRAINSKKQVYIGAIIWGVLYLIFYILVNIFFDKEKTTFLNNAKIFFISFCLATMVLFFIFQYILTSKIIFELNNSKIIIKIDHKTECMDLKNLKEVNFTQINTFNKASALILLTNEKELNIITGFIFTYKRESLKVVNIYIDYLKNYLLENNFVETDIPKINGIKEKLSPKF